MATLTKELLKELECPVCLEYFRQPIVLCTNGHNVCGKCKAQLEKCPLCRSAFMQTRNLALESVTGKLKVACRNRKFGCNKAFTLVNIMEHEAKCQWRPYKCLVQNCTTEYLLNGLIKHLVTVHRKSLHRETENSITSLTNFGKETTSNWCRPILFCDEVFVHVCTVRDSTLYTCVFHVGLEEKTPKFTYRVRIANLEVISAMRNYIIDFNQLTSCDNLESFNYQFALMCAEDNILKMNVQIRDMGDSTRSLRPRQHNSPDHLDEKIPPLR
ncbi:hypothetical protein B7P43_G04210 [Cryptotermes secundus]|uniref:RING-type E3 ubiquitin transferase n=1 Tax=Cryptotermes secundus TaxID=105785 RepID=A0A2J7PKR0_9NEOP|nr:hypothetical protein B7P43_G04210 [Cryptotermes secundus]